MPEGYTCRHPGTSNGSHIPALDWKGPGKGASGAVWYQRRMALRETAPSKQEAGPYPTLPSPSLQSPAGASYR